MIKLINKLKNRKGFTLIELIVVLAVLAIIMAIAVPRYLGVQNEAQIKADAATAQQIVNSARLQEINNNDNKKVRKGATTGESEWDTTIMEYPTPKNGTSFVLSGGGTDKYVVKWTPSSGSLDKEQTVTEGEEFKVNK